jgi:predicted PurR-regulated permease PerM
MTEVALRTRPQDRPVVIASLILMALGLSAIIGLHLVTAVISGLLVFQIVHGTSSVLRIPKLSNMNTKYLLVALLAIVVITSLVTGGVALSIFLRRGPENLTLLLTKAAEIIQDIRTVLPSSIVTQLPLDSDSLKTFITDWAHTHVGEIRTIGGNTVKVAAHMLIGFIVGAMAALSTIREPNGASPFLLALGDRLRIFADAFRRILMAQLPISAINTVLTSVYLLLILPAFGVHLPFAKTLILITFFAGLLPVIGNLISNMAILLVSLSISLKVAAISLVYLVLIHKLEYFMNARIVGARINARPWELLVAMLLLEAAVGLPGLVLAPVLYAYIKAEFTAAGLLDLPADPNAGRVSASRRRKT